MATPNSSTFLSISAILLFLYLSLKCTASSQAIASDQIKFWSENVQNKMPNPILKKLSPLTQKDTEFFTNLISTNNKFSANANFCSLAKLACRSALNTSKEVVEGYAGKVRKAYNINSASSLVKNTVEDPFSFFRLSILKQGNLIHLPDLQESLPARAFLPPQIASKISLSSIENIAKIFPKSMVGATKQSIEIALSYCNAEAIKGETKSCPKTLEEMISFTKSALGGKKLISLSSTSPKGSNTELMIKKMKKFKTDKIVACHEVFLPFATYFCHSLSSTNLYAVDLVEPMTGAPVNSMIGICHMDTSPWPAGHVAFQILKFKPGEGEACHWFSKLDLAWIAAD